jgi:HSP20 family protein
MALSLCCIQQIESEMSEQQNQQKEFFSDIKNEFKEIGSKVNRMFDEFVRGREGSKGYAITADVWETREEMVFELDVPGFSKADFSVQIRDNALVVSGSRNRSTGSEISYHLRERSFGEFERTFAIPASVDQGRIKAKYENGVLRVSLPKEAVEVEATEVAVE